MPNPADDPFELLRRARSAEPVMQLSVRSEALDRLDALLDSDATLDDARRQRLRLESAAERAIDLARIEDLDGAKKLAKAVPSGAG
jgi:hypothetical protein